jgi:recombination protein RecT
MSNNSNAIKKFTKTLEKSSIEICKALPKCLNIEKFKRVVLTEIKSNPALLDCVDKNINSLFGAIIKTAQLGLEPGNGLGHAYFLPFGNEVQFIIGYRGMIELARRSGQIESICSHCVYENDYFDMMYGLNEKLDHKPAISNRGNIIGAYSIAKIVGGGYQMEFLTKEEIDKIKSNSKSSKSQYSPWNTHYSEMCRKTAIRRLFKYLPVSIEAQRLIIDDERAEYGSQNNSSILEAEYENVDDSSSDKLSELLEK